jgi:hypothetical protein
MDSFTHWNKLKRAIGETWTLILRVCHLMIRCRFDVTLLRTLAKYVIPVELRPGDPIMGYTHVSLQLQLRADSCLLQGTKLDDVTCPECVYFIEYGFVSIMRDPQQSVHQTCHNSHPHLLRAHFRTFR